MTWRDWFRILFPIALYAGFGWWIGKKLDGHPGLVAYKFFNVVGYVMALCGMIVLSQLVVANERYKSFILEHFSKQVLAFVIFSGAALMFYALCWSEGPSAKVLEDFGPRFFFFFSMPSMLLFNAAIHGVEHKLPWSDKTRFSAFGAYLTFGGTLLQFYAALCDLFN